MRPFSDALAALGLSGTVDVLPVQSGYPSPRLVNLVLRRHAGGALLFETSAARPDIVAELSAALDGQGVGTLDGVLVTHCHGDHAGGAGIVAQRGRAAGERAPIFVHSAGYRFLTHPDAAFLQETYELFLTRSHYGLLDYSSLSESDMIDNALRKQLRHYFQRTPKRALRFVDRGELPVGIQAVFTPGHSWDCVIYLDEELGIAVPGDTIICSGAFEKPDEQAYVIPVFTVAGQSYSMAFERYLHSIRVLRELFERRNVRAVLPPHGRFAITEPHGWVRFAEGYFRGIYRALVEGYFGAAERRRARFFAKDLGAYIPSAGSRPVSTASHSFGMLCTLVDEGYLSLDEDPHTRQIAFQLLELPPLDYMERRLAEPAGTITIFGQG